MTAPTHPHVPVLLERCIELLAPAVDRPDALVLDATLGMGGHAEALLTQFPRLRLIGLDRDTQALERAQARLHRFADRTTFVHTVYDHIPDVLSSLGHAVRHSVAGVLFDLGVSSLQLDDLARGFSYSQDAPLDMRMDQSTGLSAADVVNGYERGRLARVLRDFGDERFAAKIAAVIVRERERTPFTGTARLAELVRSTIPAATRRTGGHPAKRTFQALRVEVNAELDVLSAALPAAVAALAVGGRIVVLAYQSHEDRLVKRALASQSVTSAPPGLPVVPESLEPRLRLLTRGAETASAEQVEANPRAASVRLRAAERIRAA